MPERRSIHFPHLHLVRVFAAATVLLFHLSHYFHWKPLPSGSMLSTWLVQFGGLGVDIFFILCGLVITHSALHLTAHYPVREARKIFILRRVARIFPLYLLTLLVYLAVEPISLNSEYFLLHLLSHLTMTQTFSIHTHALINGPSWSVAAEFQFYLLVWLLMLYAHRLKWRMLFPVLLLLSWLLRASAWCVAEHFGYDANTRIVMQLQMPMMLDYFVFGAILAMWWQQKSPEYSIKKGWALFGFGIALVIFSLDILLYFGAKNLWTNLALITFWRSFFGVGLMLCLAGLMYLPSRRAMKNSVYKFFYYLGDISYGIYLWQLPAIYFVKQSITASIEGAYYSIAIILILSFISWRLMEKPIIAWTKKISS